MRKEPVARRFNETKDRDPSDIGWLIPNQPRQKRAEHKTHRGTRPRLAELRPFCSSSSLVAQPWASANSPSTPRSRITWSCATLRVSSNEPAGGPISVLRVPDACERTKPASRSRARSGSMSVDRPVLYRRSRRRSSSHISREGFVGYQKVMVEEPSTMPITPPGFSTRRISLRAASGAARCCRTAQVNVASTEQSAKGN